MGDSLSDGYWEGVSVTAARDPRLKLLIDFGRFAKNSTGLTRPDRFDWTTELRPDDNGRMVQTRTSDGEHFTLAGEMLTAVYLLPRIVANVTQRSVSACTKTEAQSHDPSPPPDSQERAQPLEAQPLEAQPLETESQEARSR